jgi:hypothetical protein
MNYIVFDNTIILHVFWMFGPTYFDDANEEIRYTFRNS